jgi:hypothetical protein
VVIRGKKGGGLGTTLVLALLVVVLSMVVGVGIARYGSEVSVLNFLLGDPAPRTTTGPVVVEGIQRLDQLATVRWTESTVITKESGGNELGQFLIGERVLLVAVGEVEAGVDLAGLGSDDVEVDGEKVTIRLPEPEILSSSLDEEKTAVYDQDQGWLNFRSDDALVEEARREAETEITTTAWENGILDYAKSNAEDGLRAFVTTLGFDEVEFAE